MDQKTLDFIIKSRQSTYAAGVAPEVIDGANVYIIKNNKLEYRDIYFVGDQYFQGQEILFSDSKPIWSMSYRGAAVEGTDTEKVFKVLQGFIKKFASVVRFNENFEMLEAEFNYKCMASGDLDEFEGREEIYQNKKLVHYMDYFGGIIK